jgi:uncharacterized protein YbjT (DUF2867 family)
MTHISAEPPTTVRRIAVVGGTGTVGRLVVRAVTDAGHRPVVLSRSAGVDIVTGVGLDAGLENADAVIDVSNVNTLRRRASIEFFTAGTTSLLAAERRAGVRHHVALSIVGVDRVPSGYYEGKRQQERLVLAAATGSVLRATQWFEFAGQLLARTRGPVVVVPVMRAQPVAAAEVATAVVDLACGPVAGLAPELGGPQELDMVDMVRRLARMRGARRAVLPVRLPGAVGHAMASGALQPRGSGPRGTLRFEDWLRSAHAAG